MRRREFIALVGGATVAWPAAVRAQGPQRTRRVGVLMNRAASDPDGQARVAAFKEAMQLLGWSEGRNVQIDIGWGADDIDLEQKNAAELIALARDIVFSSGSASRHCAVSTAQCRSSLPMSPIRSARASSTALTGPAAIRLAL